MKRLMDKVSVLAITKNGILLGSKLKKLFPSWGVYAPEKFKDPNLTVNWFSETTSKKIVELFQSSEALVCIFSLGATIRLIAPYLKDKKTDPAVIIIDDKAKFVISALSGHIGGANQLTEEIARKLNSTPVITTAADVNKTIPVDLLGKKFNWKIEDFTFVTKVSAFMVNQEKIGVFQEIGPKNWWDGALPKNVTIYPTLNDLIKSKSMGNLIISDKELDLQNLNNFVVYRPPTFVVGIGLHWDTSKETIKSGLETTLKKYSLSKNSIAKFVSIKKPKPIEGLVELGKEMSVPIQYVEREELAKIKIPNPSETVKAFEGTSSVSEAGAIWGSEGNLVVEKQKFPPNLTIAIAEIPN